MPQNSLPRKTKPSSEIVKPLSFWDFKHKKVYTSKKDKVLDFIGGAILIDLLACIFIDTWLSVFSPVIFRLLYSLKLKPIQYFFCSFEGWGSSLSCMFFWLILISGLLIIVVHFFRVKRGYFSLGIIVRVLLSASLLFIWSLMFLM